MRHSAGTAAASSATSNAADLLDPESHLVCVDVSDDQVSRRSSSAAAKNAEAVLRISFARRSWTFSRLSRRTSADSAVDSGDEGLDPASIQFRRGAGFIPSSDPTWVPVFLVRSEPSDRSREAHSTADRSSPVVDVDQRVPAFR